MANVAVPMLIRIEDGKVYTSRRALTLEESKRIVECCLVYKDYDRGRRERRWLVKHHGQVINKVVDEWIRSLQRRLKNSEQMELQLQEVK
jgi:predicted deacetylase